MSAGAEADILLPVLSWEIFCVEVRCHPLHWPPGSVSIQQTRF